FEHDLTLDRAAEVEPGAYRTGRREEFIEREGKECSHTSPPHVEKGTGRHDDAAEPLIDVSNASLPACAGRHDDDMLPAWRFSQTLTLQRRRSGRRSLGYFWQTRPMTRQFSRQSCQ